MYQFLEAFVGRNHFQGVIGGVATYTEMRTMKSKISNKKTDTEEEETNTNIRGRQLSNGFVGL